MSIQTIITEALKKLTGVLSVRQLGYGLTLVFLFAYLTGTPLLDSLEHKTYDMRMAAEGVHEPGNNVVIVAIDEKSLESVGRWPWRRDIVADLVAGIDRLDPKVIVLDVFFSEPENEDVLTLIHNLESRKGFTSNNSPFTELKQAVTGDHKLAAAVRNAGNTILAISALSDLEASQVGDDTLREAFASVEQQSIRIIRGQADNLLDFPMPNNPEAAGLLVNLPTIQAGAQYTGHITVHPDNDGTLRWVPLIIRYRDHFFPSADLQAVRAYLDAGDIVLHTNETGITGVQLGDIKTIPTDESGRMLVRYRGPDSRFSVVPAIDILRGKVGANAFRDKIVIIGTTARGLGDVRTTPYGPGFPGIGIRANVIQNLLDDSYIQRPGWMKIFDVLVILSVGIALSHALPRIGVRKGLALTGALIVAYLVMAVYLFSSKQIWLNMVYPVLLMATLFVLATLFHYFSSEAQRRQIRRAFEHYVPGTVVEQIVSDADRLQLGGEQRELTVLFSDVRGFTGLSESLSPQALVGLLNSYLTTMTDLVFRHNGTLDKYIGDAIMAVYGAPVAQPDHALLACRTAVDMMSALDSLQAELRQRGLPPLDIGVGINTGSMIVGNMGSETLFDYTVIGDAVNLGSRIEQVNKTYGTHILISEFTRHQVGTEFPHLREIDVTTVRGRREPVGLYEIMLEQHYGALDWLERYHDAYRLFHAGMPDDARQAFEDIVASVDDPVSRYYIERCQGKDVVDRA